ncbi:MAG: hypothetical protein N2561_09125 [Bacteroidetes bacterium]|nr:hypothetical protein [Rhodothermia bacterium]MCS7155986.1 hypothetical protein [Bacteroidota bacterium]MCX7907674.1 hypothetical protein [Bacteroidota bacterium]MDW8137803.1 hypothetical protein [Bacteroidota bacterium]MDW8286346.1 hypothetical protein [Bacteroidota bacterium]
MKSIRYGAWLLAALLGLGCGKTEKPYFSGSIGATWTYDVYSFRQANEADRTKTGERTTQNAAEVSIGGRSAILQRNVTGSAVDTTYVHLDGDGNLWRYYRSPREVLGALTASIRVTGGFSPSWQPFIRWDAGASGYSFFPSGPYQVQGVLSGLSFTGTLQVNSTGRQVGIETVTVPAGTFRDAAKFVLNAALQGNLQSPAGPINVTVPVTITVWVARGAGIIRQRTDPITVFTETLAGTIWELRSVSGF